MVIDAKIVVIFFRTRKHPRANDYMSCHPTITSWELGRATRIVMFLYVGSTSHSATVTQKGWHRDSRA